MREAEKFVSVATSLIESRIEIPNRDIFVSTQELAEMFGTTYQTMRRSLATRRVRPFKLPGTSLVRYRFKDVMAVLGLLERR